MLNGMRRSFSSKEVPACSRYLASDYYFCVLAFLINREPLGVERPSLVTLIPPKKLTHMMSRKYRWLLDCLASDTCHHLQGRSPTVRRIAKSQIMLATRSSSFRILIMVWGCQERYGSHRHWMKQCFTHIEKRQSKVSFDPLWPAGLGPQEDGLHPPIPMQMKDPIPSAPGTEQWSEPGSI